MNVNVDLTLLELKQIVEALRYEVRVSNHPARTSREYASYLTKLADRLEKIVIYYARKDDKVRCEQP